MVGVFAALTRLLALIFAAVLAVKAGAQTRTYSTKELLARPDAATIAIPNDSGYNRAMTYRAVPLGALLSELPFARYEALQIIATDGFVAEVPASLVQRSGGARAWLAIDDPQNPWPNLPGKSYGAGPFYLVWEHPEGSKIASEQWVTATGAIVGADPPIRRWPRLDVGPYASASLKRGMNAYVTQCLPCHRFDGAGASDLGPDLGRPMNVTRYMTSGGIRAIVRDPRAVRSWPQMRMPGFSRVMLSDADLDAVVLYLTDKATTKP
jgi:mono/diheme cytochrome c family protein